MRHIDGGQGRAKEVRVFAMKIFLINAALEVILSIIFLAITIILLYFLADSEWLKEPVFKMTKGELAALVICIVYAVTRKR